MLSGPAIWPHGRTLEPNKELKIGCGIEGWVTVDLIHMPTGLIKQHLHFKNLVVDAGLNHVWAGNSMLTTYDYAAVGTDSTAPANGQTALGAEVTPSSSNRTNNNGGFVDVDTYVGASDYWKKVKTYLFTETQGNGNLTEFGLFSEVTAGVMFARQLFKDGGGSPVTVVKTASDQLRITYEIRVYHPAADGSGTITISGTPYDYVIRGNDVDNTGTWGAALGSFTGFNPFGSAGGNGDTRLRESNTLVAETADFNTSADGMSSHSLSAYVNGNFYRDQTAIWEPGTANFGTGVGGMVVFWVSALNTPRLFQVAFTPTKIPKINTQRLTLVTRGFFGRYP